MHMVY